MWTLLELDSDITLDQDPLAGDDLGNQPNEDD